MTALVIILTLILVAIIVVQIGKLTELAAVIRGEEEARMASNNMNAKALVVFMVLFLAGCIYTGIYYSDQFLGYGPHESASELGGKIDTMFNVTLFFTGIVFVITQILLFWYSYKYREQKGRKALYMPHDNKLEIVWTVIPAVVMTFLVVYGLDTWNTLMADVSPDEVLGEDYMEIEAVGHQFAWTIRYPGDDNILGERDYRLISGTNPLGQNWEDEENLDDFHPNEIVLPVGKKVRVRITAKDVLHNFYLPHFRVKMDAIPGLPTYFVFTPTTTTEEYRKRLSEYPEYQQPADPTEPDGPQRWETFEYELACAELCGKGHFSMRRIVRIVSQDEYEAWKAEQQSFYSMNVEGTPEDPSYSEVTDATDVENTDTEETEEASEEETTTTEEANQ